MGPLSAFALIVNSNEKYKNISLNNGHTKFQYQDHDELLPTPTKNS